MQSKIYVDTFVVPGDTLSLLKNNCYINYCKLTAKPRVKFVYAACLKKIQQSHLQLPHLQTLQRRDGPLSYSFGAR